MLTAVKNQFKVIYLSIKYSIMREMINKTSFLTNVLFMILNNFSLIIQWVVLFSIDGCKIDYTFKQVLLIWALAAGCFGVSRTFFASAFSLSSEILDGKLDTYLVQPKNVLISLVTSKISVSAIGDLIFSIFVYILSGFTIKGFLLFIIFIISGGIMLAAFSVILNSFSFWFTNFSIFPSTLNSVTTNFSTYPEKVFTGITKVLLYTIVPVGISVYIPFRVLVKFSPMLFLCNIVVCLILVLLSFIIFNSGLKRYSSGNLMNPRV